MGKRRLFSFIFCLWLLKFQIFSRARLPIWTSETTLTLTPYYGCPSPLGTSWRWGGGGCGCSFFSIMSFIPAVPRHHPPPRLSIRTSLACLLPHLPCSPNTCRQSTRHRIANAHLLCHPLDSANCLGWGTHTAFLRPAESRELCLCVLIGFLGYGTRDG